MNAGWKLLHAGVVVKDLDAAVRTCSLLGPVEWGKRQVARDESRGEVIMQFVKLGDFEIEFFQPVSGQNMVSDFLARHGEGVHHLAYQVEDMEAEIARLRKAGLQPVEQFTGPTGNRICFYEPGNLGNMLIELLQPA